MPQISIQNVLETYAERLGLELVAGTGGVDKKLGSSDVYRPGLVLAGFVGLFTYDRAQILGNTEMLYLMGMSVGECRVALETIYQFDVPCVVVTDDNQVLPVMAELADSRGIPLLKTPFSTTKFSHLLSYYLDDFFAPSTAIHGSLVDVYGIGLLLVGRSGIGKSEIALDLVERGHRLVADDVVLASRRMQGILVGTSGDTLRDHMEIRGIGVVNVRRMFGVRAVRLQKRIEVVVGLVEWDDSVSFERVGLEDEWMSILDVEIPRVMIPIYPGKNITVIAEAIALNYQLKTQGYHTAQEFSKRLMDKMGGKRDPTGPARVDLE